MYDIAKETPEIRKEIEIRGRYLMMSCDIEYCLLNIIVFCNPDPYNHNRTEQFKKMQMSEKINCVICDLKKYHKRYYAEFESDLNGLEEFRIVRNDMSHHKGDFPNAPDLSVFRVAFVENDETGTPRMRAKDYTDDYISDSMKRFFILNHRLTTLWMALRTEFGNRTHPFVHPSDTSQD